MLIYPQTYYNIWCLHEFGKTQWLTSCNNFLENKGQLTVFFLDNGKERLNHIKMRLIFFPKYSALYSYIYSISDYLFCTAYMLDNKLGAEEGAGSVQVMRSGWFLDVL